jgi:hypothetical protein
MLAVPVPQLRDELHNASVWLGFDFFPGKASVCQSVTDCCLAVSGRSQ